MASAVEQVFHSPELCAAILALLPATFDVATAASVSKSLRAAAQLHWAARRARTLPLSRIHGAVGDAAALRVFNAAARAAREQAAWAVDASAATQLQRLRFVLHVHAADGALIFAAAATPRLSTAADGGRRWVEFAGEDGAERLGNALAHGAPAASLFLDAPPTASLFVERVQPRGGVRVACLFADAPAEVRRAPAGTLQLRDDDDEEDDDYYEAAGWVSNLSARAHQAAAPAHAVVFTSMRRPADPNDSDAVVALPPLLDFGFGAGNFMGVAATRSGWFAATLHVPVAQPGAHVVTSRDVTASLHCALFRYVMAGAMGLFSSDTDEQLSSEELLSLLRCLQLHCA